MKQAGPPEACFWPRKADSSDAAALGTKWLIVNGGYAMALRRSRLDCQQGDGDRRHQPLTRYAIARLHGKPVQDRGVVVPKHLRIRIRPQLASAKPRPVAIAKRLLEPDLERLA